MFVTDRRLDMFKNGIMIGIFAPTLRQAQISFSRMKKRMNSTHAQTILSDPEINIDFDVSNGQNIMLTNGSLISSQSASEGSNIEGDSYMLIIVDESQDVGNFKYSKSISPMGAFYNATKILIGTSTTQKGFFYESIERNKKEYANGGKRNHFEYDYKTVIKYNPNYEKYIEGEKKRVGEHSITGDRNVTVRINGLITTMPIEELYNLFNKDSNQGEGKVVPTNLEALSASKGKIIDSLFDLKEYHLTPKQIPVIKALQEIGHTNYNYKQLIAEKTGLSLNRVSHVLAHVRKLMKQGYYYEIVPEWNKVTNIIKHKNKHNIYRMSNGQGETVVTECHSLMEVVKDGLREVKPLQASDLYRIREIPIDSYLDFVDFNFLLGLNDEVYNEYSFTQFVKEDGFIKLVSRRDKTPSIRIREKLEVGSEEYKAFCRILGAYVSEGHVLQRDLTAEISSNNIEWIRQLQRDVQLVFNYNAPIVISNKLNSKGENYGETYKLCLNSKLIGIILKTLCGQGSYNKKIPNFLFNVSRDNVKDFLKYLVEGDGYKIKGESNFGYTTASLQLASGLQLLLTQLGRSVHVQRNKNGYYTLKTQEEGILNRQAKLELELLDKSKYEYVYDLEVENAHTFVDSLGQVLLHNSDEFQMSYNLKWILERGMFVSGKLFDELADPTRGLSIGDTKKAHVVGIDLGKKQDSTVITVLEVDWDNPAIVDKAQEAGVPDYIAYPVFIKAWKEIQGDDWNEQYDIIMDFLSNFNVVRIVMDATGVGDAIYDRLRANLNYEVIPYVLTRQSKSDLYKHLNSEFRAKRVRYPANEETRETREFQKFVQQFLDLEKGYSGQLMVVSHPNIAGAHDDYCLSLNTEILTKRGFLKYNELTENDLVAKVENNKITYVKPNKVILKDYEGKMYRFKSKDLCLEVTENHKMLLRDKAKREIIALSQELTLKSSKTLYSNFSIPVAPIQDEKEYPISDELLKLCAWLITEGWINKDNKYNSYRYSVAQLSNKEGHNRISSYIAKLKLEPYVYTRGDGVTYWTFHKKDNELFDSILKEGIHRIPREWLSNLSQRQLKLLLDELMLGDGTLSRNTYHTKSLELARDFQELAHKVGIKTSIREQVRHNHTIYACYLMKQDETRIQSYDEYYYKGKVWCVNVDNGFIVTRCDNKIAVTGNCDSLALAVWGARGDEVYRPVTEKENIYKTKGNQFVLAKNNFTAKRR